MAQRPIGYWLGLVDRLIEERFVLTLEEHGVTRRQWQLLNVMGGGAATREELDAAVSPSLGGESTETETETEIAELVESDWVSDSVSGFVLTPRGQLSFDRLSEVVGGIRAELAEGIPDDEYETTMRSLEIMARNLGWNGE